MPCVALWFLAGCGAHFPLPAEPLVDASEALALMHSRVAKVTSVAMEARASYYSAGKARKGTVEIALKRPAALFFAILSPTGDMLAVLASDSTRFVNFSRGGQRCLTGCSTPENLGRLIPLTMEGQDAVSVLLGIVPVIAYQSATLRWSTDEGAYCLLLSGTTGKTQELWIEHGTGWVRRSEIRQGAHVLAHVTYAKPKKVRGVLLPHRLRIQLKDGASDLKLELRELELNPATITDATFRLKCPAGTTIQTLGCPLEIEHE